MVLNNCIIFTLSVFSAVVLIILERLFGIGWDYHPDAVTYINHSSAVCSDILRSDNWLLWLNNGHYCWVSLFQSEYVVLIVINILLFSLTNVLLNSVYKRFIKQFNVFGLFNLILFILVVLSPYRIHLSIHILKETLIIFLLVLVVTNARLLVFFILPILSLRIASLAYLTVFINKRVMKLIVPLFALIFIFTLLFNHEIVASILNFEQKDMVFREFDNVPTFTEYGIYGTIIRVIIWPVLALTGMFFILSPALLYFPLSMASLMTQLWIWITFRRFGVTFSIFVIMMVFALLVTGFTSYIRYVYPILTVLPIVLMLSHIKRYGHE